jgi:hypothetical protein
MTPIQPNEFRYHADSGVYATLWLLGVAGLLLFASAITLFWGVASLAHANWLEVNDLPVGNYDFWGVAMLCLAAVQGSTALLLVFAPAIGIVLGIVLALVNMSAQLAVISAYPLWSLIGIGANLTIVYILLVSRPRHGH